MNNKFASFAADVSAPYKVELIDPVTEEVIRDKNGSAAFICIWAADSEKSREYDKQKRKDLILQVKRSRTGKVEQDDALDANIAKCAFLTESWYLVDRVTLEPIDVPCTAENAADLYSPPGMGWIFLQPWVEANNPANFLQKPSKPSVTSPKVNSAQAES